MSERRVLLTGATGFVGGAVYPALRAAGWQVRCLTRDAEAARRRRPDASWVTGDVGAMARALEGCEAALYLVHGMGEGGAFERRDRVATERFSRAAASAGVRRIVYLGGMAPQTGSVSTHLRSRLQGGEVLRSGPVPAIELRASMIVGAGSLSCASAWFDLGGPEVLSGKQILDETARALGLPRPWTIALPVLTPRLSSLWVRFVTRARWSVAREVVVGLTHDLLAHDDRFWSLIGHERRLPFAEAARRALAAEAAEPPMTGAWAALERARLW